MQMKLINNKGSGSMEQKNEVVYSNSNILAWMSSITDKMGISPEKVKIMNVCGKKKNVIPTIESHKRVLVFVDGTHKDLCYDIWEAGLGECDVWYGTGIEPTQEMKCAKIKKLINKEITEPTVLFVINENTRESYRIGIKNENFSRGTVRYVGNEIRAVIMSLLDVDAQDCVCIVSGESIVIEAAIAASEGTIIAVEGDDGSMQAMEENADKFGVHNVEIVKEVSQESMKNLPAPRLAFIVASLDLEQQIEQLLKLNPTMQFVIYTLELDIFSGIKGIFQKYHIKDAETMQISVSKTNSKSVFVAQPSPWLITGQAVITE